MPFSSYTHVIETTDIAMYIHTVLILKLIYYAHFPDNIYSLDTRFSGLVICHDIDLPSLSSRSTVQMNILMTIQKLLLNCSSCITNDWQHYRGSNGGNTIRNTLKRHESNSENILITWIRKVNISKVRKEKE